MKTTTDGGSNIYPVHAGKLVGALISAQKVELGPVAGESHLDTLLREEVLVALATFDHSETQKELMKRLRSYLDVTGQHTGKPLPPQLTGGKINPFPKTFKRSFPKKNKSITQKDG